MVKNIFQTDGLELRQVIGPYMELYFHWDHLPTIDLQKEYYLVEMVPKSKYIATEYAKPNSSGPLHFCLKEGIEYQLNLLSAEQMQYQVDSGLSELPHVDMVKEHENLHRLVWGNIDLAGLKNKGAEYLEIYLDNKLHQEIHLDDQPESKFIGTPENITVRLKEGTQLFSIQTNLKKREIVKTVEFTVPEKEPEMFLSTIIKQQPGWKVRAEIPATFQVHQPWQKRFLEQFPATKPEHIIGCFRFYEGEKISSQVRQWGFSTEINYEVIQHIQTEEWRQEEAKPVRKYKLQLQITSAHREMHRYKLAEKNYDGDAGLVGFTEQEIEEAREKLFKKNRHVSWDQAFLELVVYFKAENSEWQEFQRDIAHSLRWEHTPNTGAEQCRAEWFLYDITNSSSQLTFLYSGTVQQDHWKSCVVLKPFSACHLMAWWDMDQAGVESFIRSEWNAPMNEVGFYLKVHEEYLGDRNHRLDLDCPLIELFSNHRNVYFQVDSNKTYSAEIVARHGDKELALTPVSKPIVVPRTENEVNYGNGHYQTLTSNWHHTTQREVGHLHGHDSNNKAKVMLHLHMHSPNLFRVDPFREAYLKDQTWPIETSEGAQVHNPPGEWLLKNCLDSWLPLLRTFRKLAHEGVDYQVSLNISPPVAYCLCSPRFKDYMSRYLERTQSFVTSQIAVMKAQLDSPAYIWAAERHLEDLKAIDVFYNQELGKDMIGAFRQLELSGHLELSTCTVTHGMPGTLETTPASLDAQITLAARTHHRIFGDRPRGIWLAENSYFPGVEGYLSKESLHYFFAEAEAILWGSQQPDEEEYNPVMIPGSDVVAFGRSRIGRVQVWDADLGYAGHPDFKEYHHRHRGIPIKRITSKKSDYKEPYNPNQAKIIANELAQDFYRKLCDKAHELSEKNFRSIPLITCSYDAELFGHHWCEGAMFLEELLREFHRNGDTIGLTTPSHYLAPQLDLPSITPNPSTWGHEALHLRWTDSKVSWTQRELERADEIQKKYLATALEGKLNDFQTRAVEQMGAELLRAQSSDLTFVIMSGDFEEDMAREVMKYLDYFYRLKMLIDNNIENEDFLAFRLYENNMFPEMPDYYRIRKEMR